MHLLEVFEACDADGRRYAISCYQDAYDRPTSSGWEQVTALKRYQLTEGDQVERVDDHTFLTAQGTVLRRCVENCSAGVSDCVKL